MTGLLAYAVSDPTRGTGSTDQGAGEPAPDFVLTGFDGASYSLSMYRGRPVFLYFWASWCVPCREEAPLLEALWREYQRRDVVFLGVNVQDGEDDARSFLDEFNITFPNVRDGSGRVYIDYGVYGVPESFFIRRDGVIQQRWIGPLEEQQLREALESLLNTPR